MTSQEKVDANRANAKKSTGPKTEAGKQVSRYNAIKHGFYSREIVVHENERQEFEELREHLLHDCQPNTAIARELFQRVLHAAWNLHRIRRMESELLGAYANPIAHAELRAQLDCIGRHATRIERTYNRAIKELGIHRAMSFSRGVFPEKMQQAMPVVADVAYILKTDNLALHRETLRNDKRRQDDPMDIVEMLNDLTPEMKQAIPPEVLQDLHHMPGAIAEALG